MLYNMPGTAYHKTAQKVLGAAEPIMAELDKLIARLPSNANVANEARGPDVMDEDDDGPPPSPPRPLIGDLEPPVELLDLLLSEDAIKDDIDFILDKPSLDALFSYELAKEKPTLPTPEANPPKVKLTRTELLERKRQERLEAARGFRDLRSRRSSASLAQSESGPPEPPVEDSQPESGPSTQATEPEPSQDGVTETPMKAKRKQHVIAEPGKLAAEMVEEVDNQQSFKMFNEGWILPPDHVRGGRQRPAPQPTPSKKKGRGGKTDVNLYGQVLSPRRIARGKSHLAEVASTPADNETLGASGEVIAPAPTQSSEVPAEQGPPDEDPRDDAQLHPAAPEALAPEDRRPGITSDHGDAERASPRAEMLLDVDMSSLEQLPKDVPMVHETAPQVFPEPDDSSTAQMDPTPLVKGRSLTPPPADVAPHDEEEHTASDVENMLHETQSMEEVSRELEPTEEQQYLSQAIGEEQAAMESLEVEQSATELPDDETIDAEPVDEELAEHEPLRVEPAETESMDQESAVMPLEEEQGAEASDTSMHCAEFKTPPTKHDGHAESAPIEEAAEVVASGEDAMEVDDIVPTEDHPMRTEGQPAVDQCVEKSVEEQPDGSQITEDQPTEVAASGAPTAVAEEEEESSDDEPPRIIIIEHLDTPAIRHEKYLQKRLERQRKLAEAEAAERAARGQAGDEAKSDLSDLSDLSDAGEASAAGVAEEEVEEEPGTFALGEGEYLEGGTLGALLLYSSVNRQSDHLAIFSVGQGRSVFSVSALVSLGD